MADRRNQRACKLVLCLILGSAFLLPFATDAMAQQTAPATQSAAPGMTAVTPPANAPAPTPAPAPAATPSPAAAALPPVALPPPLTVAAAPPGPAATEVSIAGMIRNSDPVVKAVMAFLLLCSVSSWAAFVYKSVVLAAARRNTLAFSKAFRGATTMEDADAALATVQTGAAVAMWRAAKREWDLTLPLTGAVLAPDQTSRLLQRLVLAMGSAQEQALSRFGNWMGLLATIGSTAPFIGLFGTVWGILDSFEHISASYNTSLSVVAPGIAEALLATAFGLFAAIPATMFYNRFAREIGKLTGMLDNLTAELVVFASRDVERLHK